MHRVVAFGGMEPLLPNAEITGWNRVAHIYANPGCCHSTRWDELRDWRLSTRLCLTGHRNPWLVFHDPFVRPEAPCLAREDAVGVKRFDRRGEIARDIAGELQHQIAAAADAQERGEIGE